MAAIGPDYKIFRGDTLLITLEIKDGNGDPIDITNWTIQIGLSISDNDPIPVLLKSASITDAINGLAEIDFSAVDTDLDTKNYYYDIEFKNDGETIVQTYRGRFEICPDIIPN